ncbi:carnitine/acyl carnitine carrier, variant 3 [Coprinopsis cinerea AmutBmut pab1-1]|nr:carnitine/acyl carnitine carrier, variant 3 [Coprinopsis cinerea AmutBmut pab1-1]
MNGLVFASYRFLMKLQLENADDTPTLTQIALAGAGSGIVSSLITTPTELIKIRQQSIPTPSTARQVAWQIFRESGIKGLYRGITATALRDTGYGAYFFAVSTYSHSSLAHKHAKGISYRQYEATCRLFAPPARNSSDIMAHVESEVSTLSWPALLFAGGVAGIAGWLFTFPFDVVKTRIQASKPIYSTPSGAGLPHHHVNRLARGYATATLSTPLLHGLLPERTVAKVVPRDTNPYRSTWSTIVNSYRSEGVGVFFRGLSPTLIRAIPVNMVTFATFEACVAAFS